MSERDSPNGCEGKYRRTSSPASFNNNRGSPASIHNNRGTPHKRDSPATIAAKEAPGWEKFLGGKTSTIQFTSEEVNKIKQQQQQQKAPKVPPKPKNHHLLQTHFDYFPIHPCKSSPSLDTTAQNSPKKYDFKNSLDSLDQHQTPQRGSINSNSNNNNNPASNNPNNNSSSHSHSNSDSGLSSLSGRASTMSPISTMSTVSSSSSTTSNSSRNSLRSASIVSSCTIPLDEEEDEVDDEVNVEPEDYFQDESLLMAEDLLGRLAAGSGNSDDKLVQMLGKQT